jgi:hypothetical protein
VHRPSRALISVLLPVWAVALLLTFNSKPSRLRAPASAAANFLLAVTGVVLGIDLFCTGFGLLTRKRRIEATPRSHIRGASVGQVEVQGRIVGPYTLISPLTATECFMYVGYLLGAEEGDGKPTRTTVERLAVPFYVEDETGRLLVDPRGAELQIDGETLEYSSAMPERVRRFVSRHVGPLATSARVMECCVRPGDVLFIVGSLRENPKNTDPQSQAALEFDESFLSPQAADLQRRCTLEDLGAAVPERHASVAVAADFDLNPVAVLGKAPGQPFFISQFSDREVVGDLAWKSAAYIWGGPVLTLLGLAYLFYWAGWF